MYAYILGERFQRLPPADPLTGGSMSQRSEETVSKDEEHSRLSAGRQQEYMLT